MGIHAADALRAHFRFCNSRARPGVCQNCEAVALLARGAPAQQISTATPPLLPWASSNEVTISLVPREQEGGCFDLAGFDPLPLTIFPGSVPIHPAACSFGRISSAYIAST